jgi:hypothetical protein
MFKKHSLFIKGFRNKYGQIPEQRTFDMAIHSLSEKIIHDSFLKHFN